MTIELLDTDSDEPDSATSVSEAQKRASYIERFANDSLQPGGGGSSNDAVGGSKSNNNSRLGGDCEQDNNKSGELKHSGGDTKDSVCDKGGTRKRFDRNRLSQQQTDIKEEKIGSDQDESESGVR